MQWLAHPVVRRTAEASAWLAGLLAIADAAFRLVHPSPALWSPTTGALMAALTFLLASDARRRIWPLSVLTALTSGFPTVLPLLTMLMLAAWMWIRHREREWLVVGTGPLGRRATLPAADRLLHFHVLGPTGSGKSSTVLAPWMAQDAGHARSFTLIEPKGDLSAQVAQVLRSTPSTTLMVYDPTKSDSPHWNPLAGEGAAAGEALAMALDHLEPGTHPFYRTMSRVLLVQVVTALKTALPEQASLALVLKALTEPAFRLEIIQASGHPAIDAYFRHQFAALSKSRQVELQTGLVNQLQTFLMHPSLANTFSPPYDFALTEVIRDGLYLLAPLSSSQLGAGAGAVGTLMWHLLVQAAYSLGPSTAHRHTLYLDEFHQYVSPGLSDVLAMIRGYGVSVVLSHQDMAQLTTELQAAVLANCRSRLILPGTSGEDVERFQQEALPHSFPNPRYLKRGWAIFSPTRHGRLVPPQLIRLPRPAASR